MGGSLRRRQGHTQRRSTVGSEEYASSGLIRCVFFFSSRRRHTRFDCDWSSDVCSSDLPMPAKAAFPWPATLFFFGTDTAFPAFLFRSTRFAQKSQSAALRRRVSSRQSRSEERRVGKECRSRWSPYH